MKNSVIGFIGGGNMARSLISGLLDSDVPAANIKFADPAPEPAAASLSIQRLATNLEVMQAADVVMLAVKPQLLAAVCHELACDLPDPSPLFISIAAGIRTYDIARWLGTDHAVPIIRVMPNTPAMVGSSASALYANELVSIAERDLAENIMRAVGIALWVDKEADMDVVTALSGSGPAYFFYILEIMEKAGVNMGLSQDVARLLSLQTAYGAAKMALEGVEDAATLRMHVTSKGGTTEQALKTLEAGHLQDLFDQALRAAQQRANELAEQFGENA